MWVNGEQGLLGRFGPNGIDVHQPMSVQGVKGECLFCTHTKTTRKDWDIFVVKMNEHFGIRVPQTHMPRTLFQEVPAKTPQQ